MLDSVYFDSDNTVNQIYDPSLSAGSLGPAEISNKTGYVKIGHIDGVSFIPPNDLYPFSAMSQEGDVVEVHTFNGSFEEFTEDENQSNEAQHIAARQPNRWTINSTTSGHYSVWDRGAFNVISDPVTAQNEGIDFRRFVYAPEGEAFLQYSSGEALDSPTTISGIEVFGNTDYMISAWINTQNLSPVDPDFSVGAYIEVIPYDSDGVELSDVGIYNFQVGGENRQILSAPSGQDWTLYINKFTTPEMVSTIKLHLKGYTINEGDCTADDAPYCSGSVYIDDIKIMPALHTRRSIGPNVTISQPGMDDLFVPAAYRTDESPAEFYNYSGASFGNPVFAEDFIQADRSEMFVHYSTTEGVLSLVFFHDYPNCTFAAPDGRNCEAVDQCLTQGGGLGTGCVDPCDCNAGSGNFLFQDITPGSTIAVQDDPYTDPIACTPDQITDASGNCLSVGDSVTSGTRWRWGWGTCCTDGGMLTMPLGSWSVTIDPHFNNGSDDLPGINSLVFVYDNGDGVARYANLDREEPITISYTPQDTQSEYEPQTCRLYPDDDSLACDYYEDSGIRKKGWWGYCLEYDHYPGDDAACLQWWPVDRVEGDNFQLEEGMSYDGRYPLYHCLADEEEIIYEYRHAYLSAVRGGSDGCGNCPPGYSQHREWDADCDGDSGAYCACYPRGTPDISDLSGEHWRPICNWVTDDTNYITSTSDGWYRVTRAEPIYNYFEYMNCPHAEGRQCDGAYISPSNPNHDMFCGADAGECWIGGEYVRVESSRPASRTWAGLADAVGAEEIPRMYCTELVQTVRPSGQNMYWHGRVYAGSDYYFDCPDGLSGDTDDRCYFDEDYIYFGSAVYPDRPDDPSSWDSKGGLLGAQPLFSELPPANLPGQPRGGQVHFGEDYLKRIFAESYGVWVLDSSCVPGQPGFPACARHDEGIYRDETYRFIEGHLDNWSAPDRVCFNNERPTWNPDDQTCDGGDCRNCPPVGVDVPMTSTCDFCGVPSQIQNIMVNEQADNIILSGSRWVELSFNTIVELQQLPLMRFMVDWGNGSPIFTQPNLNIRSRPDPASPHSLFNLYDYWITSALVRDDPESDAICGDNCQEAGFCSEYDRSFCAVKPKIKIMDNWDWCNNGVDFNTCPPGGYVEFPNWIVLTGE